MSNHDSEEQIEDIDMNTANEEKSSQDEEESDVELDLNAPENQPVKLWQGFLCINSIVFYDVGKCEIDDKCQNPAYTSCNQYLIFTWQGCGRKMCFDHCQIIRNMRGYPFRHHCVSNDENEPTECQQEFDWALLKFNVLIRPIFIGVALGIGFICQWI